MLNLLDHFSPHTPIRTADELMERESVARATIYRYLSALVAKRFLTRVSRGAYSLGPRIIELDRQIRITDPLLRVVPPVMAEVRERVMGTQLLCRYYGLVVMSIHEERSDQRIVTSFDRGKPFSIFLGSPSRSILANLPVVHLQRIFLTHVDKIAQTNLGRTWPEFREKMKVVRDEGVVVASDIDKKLVGFGELGFRLVEQRDLIGRELLAASGIAMGQSRVPCH